MNKARLLLLADALETRIPAKKFNLNHWRMAVDDLEDGGQRVSDDQLRHDCGFAGCAVGWACALPEFKSEGLKWDGTAPSFRGGFGGWWAVTSFFNLHEEQAKHLFSHDRYRIAQRTDPKAVAARIRRFVAKGT